MAKVPTGLVWAVLDAFDTPSQCLQHAFKPMYEPVVKR